MKKKTCRLKGEEKFMKKLPGGTRRQTSQIDRLEKKVDRLVGLVEEVLLALPPGALLTSNNKDVRELVKKKLEGDCNV